jgi:hypothetical protein
VGGHRSRAPSSTQIPYITVIEGQDIKVATYVICPYMDPLIDRAREGQRHALRIYTLLSHHGYAVFRKKKKIGPNYIFIRHPPMFYTPASGII